MIAQLIEALRGLDPPPTSEELADALWLAERFRSSGGRATEPAVSSEGPPPRDQRPEANRTPADPPHAVAPESSGEMTPPSVAVIQAGLYFAAKDENTRYLVRSPAMPAIPRALRLARALRPLRVATSSLTRQHLDEDATAQQAAETGVWAPVLRPSPERWLDLALVVDTSSSMVVWQRTIDELQAVLEQLGAFRDVRVWRLNTDNDRLLLRTGSVAGAGSGRSPGELIDPTGRRVILVVSDCIGTAWQDGRAASLLERWGRAGPVAIVQPLPQRLWWRCAAAVEPVRFRAGGRGLANDRLSVRSRHGGEAPLGVPVPVLELEPRWFLPWAGLVGAGGHDVDGVALDTGRPVAEAAPDSGGDDLPPLERVMRFRAASSPTAFKLAGYLAAAPLRLPVMRLVQRAMLPQSTPAHLAEVFLGDLLRKVDPGSWASPDEIEYEFRDGVRDVLLGGLHRGGAMRVLREVWGVVRNRMGSSLDFPALLGAIQRGESELNPDQPFAQVAARVLTRLGGRYAEIAKRLVAAQSELGEPRGGDAGIPESVGRAAPRPRRVSAAAAQTRVDPVLWGGVPLRNPDFTGRDDLLASVWEGMDGTVTALLPQALHGLGGEGKSQLAVEYAYRYADEYDLVWWIPAEQMTLARSSLAALARRLGTPLSDDIKGTVDNVFHALQSGVPYPRWLLIYDNAQDPSELIPLMPVAPDPRSRLLATSVPSGNVLITSRDRRWEGLVATVEVDVFQRPESISFLQRRVPRLSAAQADRLAGRVGDLPLAVEQAAAWQAVTGGAAEEYLRLFDRRLAQLPAEELPADFPAQLAATLDLAFEQLHEEAPAAGRMLELWAFFGPEPVTRGLLSAGRQAGLPSPFDEVMADEDLLRNAMRDISRFALARFDPEAVSLQVHRLVRTMLQTRLSDEERAGIRGYVHGILAAATPTEPPNDETTWDRRAEITTHVLPSEIIDGDSSDIRRVALDQAQYLYVSGDFEGSRLLAEIALDRWRGHYGPDDDSALVAGRLKANALRSLGHIEMAAELDEDVLVRMRRQFGPDHPDTLLTANGVGADLRLRGDFIQAYELDRDTWGRMQQRYGSDHVNTLLAANSVGIDLRLLGDFHQAYAVDDDALQRLRRQSGNRHRNTLLAVDHLARDLHGLGRYQEALRLQRDSLEERRLVLGPDHAFVLRAEMSYAGTLRKSGAYADAERLARDTLESHIRRFGVQHPDTLAARRSLAIACLVTGDAMQGRRVSEEALAGYRRVLGDDHPFTPACAAGLGLVLRALGEFQAALDTDQEALATLSRSPLGPDHFYALCCSVGLTKDLYLLGELEAAYDRSRATLQRFRDRHGPGHPYTLACAHNHAMICRASGRTDETAGTDPVAALRQALGETHPEVRAAVMGELLECDIEPTPL